MVDFQPLSFSAFAPALQNMRDQADKEQTQQLISAALGGQMPGQPGQTGAPAQAGQSGAPNVNPGLIQAAQANPAIIGQLLSSKNPQAQQVGMFLLDRAQPKPKTYGFQTAPDGTVLRTDPNTGSVAPVYQAPKPKQVIQTPDGTVLAVDPISGEATPAYQGGPKQASIPSGYRATQGGGVEPIPGGPEDQGAVAAQRAAVAIQAGLKEGTPAFKSFMVTGKLPREDATPLTATDKKAIMEADDAVMANQSAIDNLAKAKELSKTAYSGPMAAQRGYLGALVGAPGAADTAELENTVTTNALQSLKAIFGAAPTEGERAILLQIQGSASQPREVREKIYNNAIALAQRRLEYNKQRADALRGETYYRNSPEVIPNATKDQSRAPQGDPRTRQQAGSATAATTDAQQAIAQARAAIQAGADLNAVAQRLRQNGIDPAGL